MRYTYRKGDDPSFPVQTDMRYTGQRLDAGVGASATASGLDRGLYFYNSRYYDSSLGRFLQPDTIVPNPGDPQDLNRYTYARSNPIRYSDPTGHYVFEDDPNDVQYIVPLNSSFTGTSVGVATCSTFAELSVEKWKS